MEKNVMSKYRNNAFTVNELAGQEFVAKILPYVMDVVNVDFRTIDKDQYDQWVKEWKATYGIFADTLKEIRLDQGSWENVIESDRHRAAVVLRKYANTLLNARQYAKDIRRIVTAKVSD
jgi:hypothetical protein